MPINILNDVIATLQCAVGAPKHVVQKIYVELSESSEFFCEENNTFSTVLKETSVEVRSTVL